MVPPSPIEEFPSTFAAGLKRKDAPSLGDLVAQRIADHKAELKAEHRAAKRPRHKLVQLAAPPPPPTKLDAADQSSIIYIGSSSPAPAPASKPKAKPVVSKKPEAVKKPVKKAAKPESMSVPDFVQKLMDDRAANPPKKQIYVQTFRNMTIFFWDADGKKASPSTMNKMTKLAQHGATIQPVYDPATVTHIIIGTMAQGTNCKLSFFVKKALNGAAIPEHVPTLRWSWAAGIGQRCRDPDGLIPRVILEEFWQHAFFLERRNVGVDTTRVAQRKASMRARQEANRREVQDSEDEDDRYRPMSPEQSQFSGGPKAEEASSSKEKLDGVIDDPNDPLAPFYIDAIRDLDDRPENRGYQVDQVPGIPVASPNQDIIDKLRELQAIYEVKPGQEDKWKAWSYKKSIPKIAAYPTRLKSVAEARTIPGVGKKTADKIKEILETGGLRRTHYELADGTVTAMRLFQGIYGVGESIAQKWVSNGLRTLEDLRNGEKGVKLTAAQKVGLKHYDDINDRMPREEAQALFELIKPIALKIDSKIYIEIMGSYRRGKADCGDIDIMITRDPSDGKTHAGLISQLLKKLKSAGIITDDLALPDKPHDPEAIYRGLCCLPQKGAKRRRIDFLCIPWESRGGALIYYTGDDIFNRSMRLKARRMGYSLNQRGLYEGVVRDPRRYGAKLNMGTLKASATEEEIFNILDIPFVPPVDRVRHREELLRRAGIKV
ncbi:DNA polymerase lambda [Mycena floridula]|nr:DNA polymerase lambda [Mycena floridula]